MNTENPLKIVRLTASNVMRLKAGIEIVPTDPTVVVTGANGNGKSAVLNCILFALGGKGVLPEVPVRKGAAAADVHLDLDDIVIDWRCTVAGTVSLIVRTKDGGAMKSPQTALDTLWNKMCDPVKFVRLSETVEGRRKQAEILRQIVSLDFTALDTERKSLYDEREEKGRELKNHKGALTIAAFHADVPADEISSQSLLEELQGANNHNENMREQKRQLNYLTEAQRLASEEVLSIQEQIEQLERELVGKRNELTKTAATVETRKHEIAAQQTLVDSLSLADTMEITKKIAAADGVNAKVRANAARRELEEKARLAQERVDLLTVQITEIDDEKKDKLAKAPFPVPGLAFDESGILLDGVPFAQGSQAEQLVAATAIALALKPRIRVVLLRDASLLDSATRLKVAEIAQRENAQVWEEVVESSEASAIVIEDGAVKQK